MSAAREEFCSKSLKKLSDSGGLWYTKPFRTYVSKWEKMNRSRFLQGPAGTGKTSTALDHVRALLDDGALAEEILIFVPARSLGAPYYTAQTAPDWPSGALLDIVTLGGLAQRGLELFWPLVAGRAGFHDPAQEPSFLTLETAQYYMNRLVDVQLRSGIYESISLRRGQIIRQTLDNLNKAAANAFSLDEIEARLIAAWGDRHSSRPPVYRASIDLARRFRELCREQSLLDFSFQIELYAQVLLEEPDYQRWFAEQYRHLVADNLEENLPLAADVIRWAWDDLDTALLVYDDDAGYRVFLGADPSGMGELAALCDDVDQRALATESPTPIAALAGTLSALFDGAAPGADGADDPEDGQAPPFSLQTHKFYPQMISGVVDEIATLVEAGTPPGEIVVLAPLLGDSLRFELMERLGERGIRAVSHRPSRALRDEPAARAMLTLMALAYPDWNADPPVLDVVDALQQVIGPLDPVRAWLLAQIVYRPGRGLGSFDVIKPGMQERISYRAGEQYEHLRGWLNAFAEVAPSSPPDHFLSRLFGEVLSQPGFGFHGDLEAGRVIAELVQSARNFRQVLYLNGTDDWREPGREYFTLVQEGLLAATYLSSWRMEQQNAVFLAPAYTFLMRGRVVDHQFWLDVGSNVWWERLEQPLTHPYVLARSYPADQMWTDDLEFSARRDALRRLVLGLVRRCRQQVHLAVCDLGESGYEQRGPLLQIVQRLMPPPALEETV